MNLMKKLFVSILFLIGFIVRAPVFADEPIITTFPADATGTLTIRYFDDEEETIPVAGAEFEVYQVATIGRESEDNGRYIPLTEEMNFTDENTEDEESYASTVSRIYQANPNLGYHNTVITGKDGIASLEGIPVGAYLIQETRAVRYHIKSIPFVASVPEINDTQTSWNFDVVATPKSQIAGDLEISKTVEGNHPSNKIDTFTFRIQIADGEYEAKMPDGSESTIKNGDEISIKGGQELLIYDLPEGSDYKVTEMEANEDSYTTTYKNELGQIKGKNMTTVNITNKRNLIDVVTGVGQNPIFILELAGATLTLIMILIFERKEKREENE